MNTLKFLCLGSGSTGNCYCLGDSANAIIVDAGVRKNDVVARVNNVFHPRSLWGILVTHSHGDHFAYATAIAKGYDIPLYINVSTYNEIKAKSQMTDSVIETDPFEGVNVRTFTDCEHLTIGPFSIDTIPLPHDPGCSCTGFSITLDNHNIVIATDFSVITDALAKYIASADSLVVDCNYDEQLLVDSKYDEFLKRRVAQYGHISNRALANFFSTKQHNKLQNVFLAHLSDETNNPETALAVVEPSIPGVNLVALGRYARYNKPIILTNINPLSPDTVAS